MVVLRNLISVAFAALLLSACQTMTPARFTSEQVTVLKAEGFSETPNGWELGLGDRLLFEFDERKLRTEQLPVIARLADILSKVGIHRMRVEGHADSTGTDEYNLKLSVDRARVVADALVAGGAKDADVQVLGHGATQPIETNDTPEGRQENRRVVIIVPPQGE